MYLCHTQAVWKFYLGCDLEDWVRDSRVKTSHIDESERRYKLALWESTYLTARLKLMDMPNKLYSQISYILQMSMVWIFLYKNRNLPTNVSFQSKSQGMDLIPTYRFRTATTSAGGPDSMVWMIWRTKGVGSPFSSPSACLSYHNNNVRTTLNCRDPWCKL